MGLTNEHVEPKILAKIQIYVPNRAELLITLCYETPCITKSPSFFSDTTMQFQIWRFRQILAGSFYQNM